MEERATRFAWPRAIKRASRTRDARALLPARVVPVVFSSSVFELRARARVCVCVCACLAACSSLRVAEVASPLAWIIKVLNPVSHRGSIITSKDRAMLRVASLRAARLSSARCIRNDPSRSEVASIATNERTVSRYFSLVALSTC